MIKLKKVFYDLKLILQKISLIEKIGLSLYNNRLKFMNAKAVENLPSIRFIRLLENVCINYYYNNWQQRVNLEEARKFALNITENCGFEEGTAPQLQKILNVTCGLRDEKSHHLPFLVALYKNSGSQFFCAGNFISSRHVLTAAHCIHKKNSFESFQPDAINVSMGSGLMSTGVKRIKIHPK